MPGNYWLLWAAEETPGGGGIVHKTVAQENL